jgi:hypothetical protein
MKSRAFRILATSGVAVALIASGLLATFVPAAAAAAGEAGSCCPLMAAGGGCDMPPGMVRDLVMSCCDAPDVPPNQPVDEALPQAPPAPDAPGPAFAVGAGAAPAVATAARVADEAPPEPSHVPLFTLHAAFLI